MCCWLISNEATSALDSITEEEITKTIQDIARSGNHLTILIAHRLSTIKYADRIYVVEKGSIVESGNHQDLLDKKDCIMPCGGNKPVNQRKAGYYK